MCSLHLQPHTPHSHTRLPCPQSHLVQLTSQSKGQLGKPLSPAFPCTAQHNRHYPTQPELDQGFPHPHTPPLRGPAGSTKDSSCSLRLNARLRLGPPTTAQRGYPGEQHLCLCVCVSDYLSMCQEPLDLILTASLTGVPLPVSFTRLCLFFITVSLSLFFSNSVSVSAVCSLAPSPCLYVSLQVPVCASLSLFLAPTLCG